MRLVKNIGLATTVCMLLGVSVWAEGMGTTNIQYTEASEVQKAFPKAAPVREMTIPNTFTANTPAVADEVNANFTAAKSMVDENIVEIEALKASISSIQQYVITNSSTPLINTPQAAFEADGWSICASKTYREGGIPIGDVLAACSAENLMLACRQVGDPNFVVAAYAPRADVLFNTPYDTNTSHLAHGAEWYYNEDQSWGFAKGGDTVNKDNCDFSDFNNEYRMCNHMAGGELTDGWSCGTTMYLNNSSDWEFIILQK